MPPRPRLVVVIAVVALMATMAACGSAGPAAGGTGPVAVVAGANFWGDIVGQIGGDHVQVTSIIDDPNVDPHEYEASARTAAALSTARLVIENGLGYDEFLDTLMSASPNSARTVLSVAQVLGVSGEDANPHLWYDTARLPAVADAIGARLARLDPAHAADYTANVATFTASLRPVLAVIATIKQKYTGSKIAYTERVPGFLVDATGLKLGVPDGFPRAVEDGNDPSPADTQAFTAAITGKQVKVLLYNSQVADQQTADLKALATTSGVPVVAMTEILPGTDVNFQAWQLRQDTELLKALGG